MELFRSVNVLCKLPNNREIRREVIRLAMTDYASSVVLPPLAEILAAQAPGITPEVVPSHERVHEDNGLAGANHLIFSPLAVPATYRVELLFEDVFLCILGRKLSCGKGPLKMKEYISFRHISVETLPSRQPLMDCSLGEAGQQRRAAVHVPYLLAAIRMLETIDLVLTVPTRIAEPALSLHDLRHLKAPKDIPPIRYSMVWHPRFDSDLLHVWLRETVRQIFRPNASTVRP
jgi:LysR family transcriptional regulator, nod-box dependent transcriptional activator